MRRTENIFGANALLVLRIAGAALCFFGAWLFFADGDSGKPRFIHILTATGALLLGILLLVWHKAPAWVLWLLTFSIVAGVYSGDVYEVANGEKHWLRLLPPIGLLLVTIFGGRREGSAN